MSREANQAIVFYTDVVIDDIRWYDELPTGDGKRKATNRMKSWGGNGVDAAIAAARQGSEVYMVAGIGEQQYPQFRKDMESVGITVIPYFRKDTPDVQIGLVGGHRQADKCEMGCEYLEHQVYPNLDVLSSYVEISRIGLIQTDGNHGQNIVELAKAAREKGIITSFDGSLKPNTADLLPHITIAICGEDFAQKLFPDVALEDFPEVLISGYPGMGVAGVTVGEDGLHWIQRGARKLEKYHLEALHIPSEEMKGASLSAGDIFHGAMCASYVRDRDNYFSEHMKCGVVSGAFCLMNPEMDILKKAPDDEQLQDLLARYNRQLSLSAA